MKKIVFNNPKENIQVLSTLLGELEKSTDFFLSVAFFNLQGIQALKTIFSDLETRGVRGRILTGTYQDFNQKADFLELLKIPNIEVRVLEQENFHPKMYLFKKENGSSTLLSGSSNLTNAALKENIEFNTLIAFDETEEKYIEIVKYCKELWEVATPLTEEWVAQYTPQPKVIQFPKVISEIGEAYNRQMPKPNSMQKQALENIEFLREKGEKKGLLISATGTGKTFLAAFDVAEYQPKRLLFLAHRETLLKQAKETFHKLMPEVSKGILSGTSKEVGSDYLFATVQTISKNVHQFHPEEFDYIIIDESHHSAGATYQKILEHFTPKWLMGMTATPERSDSYDVFEIFDHNIIYEIRLQDALDANLLAPFNYFGVSEEDAVSLKEGKAEFSALVSDLRVHHVLKKIDYYCPTHEVPKGIVFTSTVDEAKELANKFSHLGRPSVYLSAQSNEFERELRIRDLEEGKLHYIFVRDLFNEGIDIPSVNRIIMLRQTESSIVFIQQLGRGLRKFAGKESCTVLDFIGNYTNNYMIPIALSGDNSGDKRPLIRNLTKGNIHVNIGLESIPKERILKSIQSAQLNSAKIFKESYQYLRAKLGRIPLLSEFIEHNQVDPWRLANHKRDYVSFLEWQNEENLPSLTETEKKILHFLTKQILKGIRLTEVEMLSTLIKNEKLVVNERDKKQQNALRVLSLEFFGKNDKEAYGGVPLVYTNSGSIHLSNEFSNFLEDDFFKEQVMDILFAATLRNQKVEYANELVVGKSYSYTDVCRMLNWESDGRATIMGYKSKDDVTPIFVNLDKSDDAIQYADQFESNKVFSWHSRRNRTTSSSEIQKIVDVHNVNHLFVKKKDEEQGGQKVDFIYLGVANVLDYKDDYLDNVPIVNFTFELATPVEENLYEYLNA